MAQTKKIKLVDEIKPDPNNVKIIQIIGVQDKDGDDVEMLVYGLSEDNNIYKWMRNTGDEPPFWGLYDQYEY